MFTMLADDRSDWNKRNEREEGGEREVDLFKRKQSGGKEHYESIDSNVNKTI